jgi:hypothetical protein
MRLFHFLEGVFQSASLPAFDGFSQTSVRLDSSALSIPGGSNKASLNVAAACLKEAEPHQSSDKDLVPEASFYILATEVKRQRVWLAAVLQNVVVH